MAGTGMECWHPRQRFYRYTTMSAHIFIFLSAFLLAWQWLK